MKPHPEDTPTPVILTENQPLIQEELPPFPTGGLQAGRGPAPSVGGSPLNRHNQPAKPIETGSACGHRRTEIRHRRQSATGSSCIRNVDNGLLVHEDRPRQRQHGTLDLRFRQSQFDPIGPRRHSMPRILRLRRHAIGAGGTRGQLSHDHLIPTIYRTAASRNKVGLMLLRAMGSLIAAAVLRYATPLPSPW